MIGGLEPAPGLVQVLGDFCDAIHDALETFTSVGGRCCRGMRTKGQQSDRDDDDHLSHGSPSRVRIVFANHPCFPNRPFCSALLAGLYRRSNLALLVPDRDVGNGARKGVGRACNGDNREGRCDSKQHGYLVPQNGLPHSLLSAVVRNELDHIGQVKPGGHTQTQPTPSTSMQ